MAEKQKTALSDKKMMMRAIKDSFIKLKPKTQAGNPVMLLVYLSAIMTTGLWLISLIFGIGDAPTGYTCAVAVILWFTVLFANFAEAIAEGRGKAQADSLRKAKKDVDAHKIPSPDQKERITVIPSTSLKKGDLVLVKAGEQIPGDGEVVDGAASVDESAITGESAPVIRDSGGDRSAVTGGTTVLSDWIVVRITSEAGETFMDKMIAMVEGANRKKTPNEIALQIFLVALSIVFIMVTMSLYTYSMFSAEQAGIPNPTSITTLVALLVCLAPTTIGALLSAIGIAGMSRLNQANVLAMSGRAIEAAGDVDILMLDKTGTITLGNRRADAFIPVDGASEKELADAAQLSSLADETPEGRSVVVLAKEKFGIRERSLSDKNMEFVPFTAVTRMSGVNFAGTEIRKGAADAIKDYVVKGGEIYSPECDHIVKEISSKGGTPLVVAKNHIVLGVIYLKDIIKDGVQEKFADLRKIEKEKKLWSQTTISDMLKNEVYTFNASALGGKNLVTFEELYDLSNPDEPVKVAEHKDIEDDGQTVLITERIIKIHTTATDKDGNKEIEAGKDVTIIDTVTLEGLEVGTQYKLVGWQMLKEENAELLINGKRVESDYTFIADSKTMKVEVAFTFDATSLDGKQLVTFEELYDLSNPDEPKKVTEHKDIEDKGQTITFKEKPEEPEKPETPPTPEKPNRPSDSPKTGDSTNVMAFIVMLLVSAGGLAGTYLYKRRKMKKS